MSHQCKQSTWKGGRPSGKHSITSNDISKGNSDTGGDFNFVMNQTGNTPNRTKCKSKQATALF